MSDAFLSSDEYDEQAHQLYNEGRYDDALALLNEGLSLYPHAVELHVGMAYAQLAREEYAWARRSFEAALSHDPEHEDALAGLGEALLKLGERTGGIAAFERILALGLHDDHELMLQVGRALFREGLLGQAHRYFELAAGAHPDSADAAACLGLRLAPPRPRGAGALLAAARPGTRRDLRRGADLHRQHPLRPERVRGGALPLRADRARRTISTSWGSGGRWSSRRRSIASPMTIPSSPPGTSGWPRSPASPDPVDELLAEVEGTQPDGTLRDPHQLELFGTMLSDLTSMQRRPTASDQHLVVTLAGLNAPRHLGGDPGAVQGRRPEGRRRLARRLHGGDGAPGPARDGGPDPGHRSGGVSPGERRGRERCGSFTSRVSRQPSVDRMNGALRRCRRRPSILHDSTT